LNRLVVAMSAVVIALIIGVAIDTQIPTGVSLPVVSITTSTITTIQEQTATVAQPVPTTEVSTMTKTQTVYHVANCGTAFDNGTLGTNLVLNGANSSIVLCVRYWYYNSTNVITFFPLNSIEILGHNGSSSYLSNFTSEFSITSSSDQILMGRPDVLNEGTAVSYTISLANRSSSDLPDGTYFIYLNGILYPQWLNCGGIDLELVLGVETVQSGPSCLNVLGIVSSFSRTLDQYGFLDGVWFVEIPG